MNAGHKVVDGGVEVVGELLGSDSLWDITS